jgi:hypothetical protein
MNLLLTLSALTVAVILPGLTILGTPPRTGYPMLVVMPPWLDAPLSVTRAGGQIIGPEIAPFATLAISNDPSFASLLHQQGAWAVRDGSRLDQLCGARS